MVARRNPEHRDSWTAFGLGVLGGTIGGLSLLSFAGIFLVALIAIVGGLLLRPRPFGAAGVLCGWGVTTLIVLAGAQARCEPGACTAPDLTGWFVVAAGLIALGVLALIVGVRRQARPAAVDRDLSSRHARPAQPVGSERGGDADQP